MGLLSFLAKPKWIKVQRPPKRFIKTGTVVVELTDDIASKCPPGSLACTGDYVFDKPNRTG